MVDPAGNSAGKALILILTASLDPGDHFAPSHVPISHFATILSRFEDFHFLTKMAFSRWSKIFKILILARNFDQKFFGQNLYMRSCKTHWGTVRTKIQLCMTKIAISHFFGEMVILAHFWAIS